MHKHFKTVLLLAGVVTTCKFIIIRPVGPNFSLRTDRLNEANSRSSQFCEGA